MKERIATILACMTLHILQVSAQDPYENIGTFSFAAINIDGLPPTLNVLGFIPIKLNPDAKEGPGATAIGTMAAQKGWDVIGVSEDFNYDEYLMKPLKAAGYQAGTYRGGITANADAYMNLIAKKPVTNTDGLNLIWKSGLTADNETMIKWNKYYGYTDNGADGLINKGFRSYIVKLADNVFVDVYILHMDAEVTDGDLKARDSQLTQLSDAIKNSKTKHPKIVMGDTNCRYTRDYVKEHFIDIINNDGRFTINDGWIEKCKDGIYPQYGTEALMVNELGYTEGEIVDKMFYINTTESPYSLVLDDFTVDTNFNNDAGEPLADHYPIVGTFSIHKSDRTPTSIKDTNQPTGKEISYTINGIPANKVDKGITISNGKKSLK